MRSLTVTLILLVLSVAIMLGLSCFLRQSCDQLLNELARAPSIPDAATIGAQLDLWEQRTPWLNLAAPRNTVRRVRELLLILQSCAEVEPSTPAQMTLAELRDAIEQLKKDTLSFPIG